MPDKIRGFQMMVLISLAFGAGAMVLLAGQLAEGGHAGFIITVQLVLMGMMAPLGHMIAHRGWGWARWACAILWCVGLPFLLMAVMLAYRGDPLIGALLAAEVVLQGGAVGLLFTEDSGNWFEA